jgi:hypothetical protein
MGTFLHNFNQSGDLENDVNLSARDSKFWSNFVNKQPMWMFIYLLWNHGEDSGFAWNAITLPASQQIDFGAADDRTPPPPAGATINAPPSGGKRKKRAVDDDPLLNASSELLSQLRSTASTTVTSVQVQVAPAIANADNAKALAMHADVLKSQWSTLPAAQDDVRALLFASWVAKLTELAAVGAQR